MNVHRAAPPHFIRLMCLMAFVWSVGLPPFTATARAVFPERAITYLIPFAPGGESDIFAQAQLPFLEKELGQQVSISYVPGGGGAVGWGELVRAGADGYFVAGFNLPHIILQPLQRRKSYKTKDIRPVMIFMNTPCVLAVKKDSPYATLDDFLKATREHPGSLTLGGSGSATAGHLAVIRLNKLASVKVPYVPFTGTGEAMPALLSGHVSALMTFTTMGVQHKDDMRILAVATPERFPALPDVPTFRELGFDLVEGAYRGLAVPPGTPDEVIDVLYKACAAANADPGFVARMTGLGFLLENLDPAQSEALVDEKIEIYKDMLKELK